MCLTKKSRLCFARWETRSWRKSRLLKIAGRDCFFFFFATGFSGSYAPRTGKLYNKKDKEGKKMEKAKREGSCFAEELDMYSYACRMVCY